MNFQQILKSSKTVWLSTHKNADGDGLGSEIALYHALKNMNYNVHIIHNDAIPARYHFLLNDIDVKDAGTIDKDLFSETDVALIFDTHDPVLCSPLFEILQQKKIKIVFIDHHVVFKKPLDNAVYMIDENSSCTGEIVLDLIKGMNQKLDKNIATAIYTSLIFDTQSFRVIRDSTKPFDIAKELIAAGANHKQIQQNLFNTWSMNKMKYLSKLINDVVYTQEHTALIPILQKDLQNYELSTDDVSDFVDLFMSLKNLQTSIVLREEDQDYFKMSFRSRSREVLSWAREFGGGGHLFSSGAWVRDTQENIISKLNKLIQQNA